MPDLILRFRLAAPVALFILLSSPSVRAQTWEWIKATTNPTVMTDPASLTADAAGNVYAGAYFTGSLSWGGLSVNATSSAVAYAKFDSLGQAQWLVAGNTSVFISPNEFNTLTTADPGGNFFVAEKFIGQKRLGSLVLNPGTAGEYLSIGKIGPTGVPQWLKAIVPLSSTPAFSVSSCITDAAGNLYVMGFYVDMLQSGPVSISYDNQTIPLPPRGSFLMKINAAGQYQWVAGLIQGSAPAGGFAEPASSFTGFSSGLAFSQGIIHALAFVNSPSAQKSLQWLRFDPQGNFLFSSTLTSDASFISEVGLSVNASGEALVYGNFSYFNPGAPVVLQGFPALFPQSTFNFFVAKYNAAGQGVYIRSSDGFGEIIGRSYLLDQGDVVLPVRVENFLFAGQSFSLIGQAILHLTPAGTVDWIKEGNIRSRHAAATQRLIYGLGSVDASVTMDGIPVPVINQNEAWVGKLGCGPPSIWQVLGPTQLCTGTAAYQAQSQNANSLNVSYTWQVSGGGTVNSAGSQATVTWTTPGLHTLTVTPVNSCKPGTPFSFQVEVKGPPPAPPVTGDSTVCLGQAFYQTPVDSALTYQWSLSGGGVLTSLGSSASVSWSGPGAHTLSLRATNECGQGPPRNLTVAVVTPPTQPTPIAGNAAVCPGAQAYSVTPSPGVNYLWNLSGGGSLTSIQNAATVNWSASGSYILTVIPENLCGAGPARNLVVSANEPPAQPATLIGDANPCLGLGSYSVLALPGVSYQWNVSGGGGLVASGASAQVAWASQGLHSLSVTPVNVCGAGPARTAVIQVSDAPTQPDPVQGLDSVCLGPQLYGIAQAPGVNYIWNLSGGGALSAGGSNASVNWTTPGFHTLSLTPINGCGTGPTRTRSVFVRNTGSQAGALAGDSVVCAGATTPYAVTPVSGFTYQWSLSGGGSLLASGPLASVAWNQPGLHFMQVLTSDGCVAGKPVQVNAAPSPLPIPTGPDTVCTGNAAFATQFIPGLNYLWSLSGGGILSPAFHTANVQFQAPGSWTLTVQALDACGSSAPSIKQIEVIAPPGQAPNFPPRDTLCAGIASFSATASPANSLFWSLTGPVSVQASGSPVNLAINDTGNYVLQVNEANACGSGPAASQFLRVIQPPRPPLIQLPAQVCVGDTLSPVFTGRSFPEDEAIWSFSGPVNAVGSGNTLRLVGAGAGTLRIRFFARNKCGASIEDSTTVTIQGTPQQPGPIQGNGVSCPGIQPYRVPLPLAGETVLWQLSSGGNLSVTGVDAFIGWATPGAHTLSAAYANACATGPFQSLAVTVNSTPSQPVPVQWPAAVCIQGASFAVVHQPGVNYVWNASGGAQLTAGSAQATVVWPSSGLFTLSITPENACGIGLAYTQSVAVDRRPDRPVLVTGDTLLCSGPMRYAVAPSVQPSGLPANYSWTAPQGVTVADSLNTAVVNWSAAGRYELAVTAANGCGTSDTARFTVKIDTAPAFSAPINGPSGVCLENALYQVVPADEEKVRWSLRGGGLLTATGPAARVSWQQTGQYLITAEPGNACGIGKADSLIVTVYDLPERISLLEGPSGTCAGNTIPYLAANPNQVALNWEASGGVLISSSDLGAQVRWDQEGMYTLAVVPVNLCGAGPQTQKTVRVDKTPSAPVFLEGDTLTCEGLTLYRATASGFNLEWTWEISNGGELTTLGEQALVNWSSNGSFIVRVRAANSCGAGPGTDLLVQVVSAPVVPQLVRRGDSIFAVPSMGTQWYFNDEPLASAGQSFLIPTEDGVFTARNTNLCGVSARSQAMLVADFFPGIPRRPFLFPNPASGRVTVQIPPYLGWDRIRIIDLRGRVVDELRNTGAQRFELGLSDLAAGAYVFEFYSELLVVREKLIVE